jgi:hypothetical protein
MPGANLAGQIKSACLFLQRIIFLMLEIPFRGIGHDPGLELFPIKLLFNLWTWRGFPDRYQRGFLNFRTDSINRNYLIHKGLNFLH